MESQTTPQPNQNQPLDPTIVNMARAIKQAETGGSSSPYTAAGASGEYGAYQYTADTWAADSQKYLGQSVPLQGASVAQQNEVAYKKIADLKAAGYNPAQVASIWNSGNANPEVEGTGTNPEGVKYDVPGYVNKVVTNYNNLKSGITSPQTSTTTPPDQSQGQPGLMSQLGSRASDAGSNLSDIANQLQGQKGTQNWWSDLLQTGGDVAGGVGDIINAGLNKIPGVSGAENWLGGEIGKAADTQVGQQVTSAIQDFQQAHPEASKDIGAGFNILTAIPILRGLGAVTDVASSGLGQALRGVASKGLSKEIIGTAGRTVGGRAALASLGDEAPNVIQKGIIDTGSIPDIADGKYDVSEALNNNESRIADISEKELQPILDRSSTGDVSNRVALEDVRKEAITNATNELQDPKAVNDMFDRIQSKYGEYPTIAQYNEAKRLVSAQIPQKTFDLEGYNAKYNVRQTLQGTVEKQAQALGLPDVNEINGRMSLLYKANKLLSSMHGKPIKIGLASKLARKGVSVGAGMIANHMGGGVLGGLGAGYLTDIADKGVQGLGAAARRSILERTAPGAFKAILKKGAKKAPGALSAVLAQKEAK